MEISLEQKLSAKETALNCSKNINPVQTNFNQGVGQTQTTAPRVDKIITDAQKIYYCLTA